MDDRDEDARADAALDALIRRAAEVPADEAATRRAVLARLSAPRRRFDLIDRLPAPGPGLAAASLAAAILVAGAGGYALPDLLGGVDALSLLDLAAGGLPSGAPGGGNGIGPERRPG